MTKLLILMLCGLLAGCGVVDTTATSAAVAKAKAAEIERAKQIQQKAIADMQQANEQAQRRLQEAEGK